ncbi:MAG: hypothetical protein JST36_02325 [Bacteroidetes bacterium]|nr:hypothetical protein [Bacteroidota bacterium]
MKKLAFVVLPTFCLLLCSCAGGWTEDDKNKLRDDCLAQARTQISEEQSKKYCACFVEQMVAKYPVFNDMMRGYQTDTIEALKKHCRAEIGLP